MLDREKLLVKNSLVRAVLAFAAVLLCALMLAGCSGMNEAEKQVTKELDALKRSDSLGGEVITLRDSLSDEGKEDFDEFLEELRDFDYEITGSREDDSSGESHTVVKVRIKTYDFGKEYLAAWTEYLKSHKDGFEDDADAADFYELLFERLADIDGREYIKDIEIICVDPLDNGEWIANIKENEELQDAIFGGMMSEMKTLAADK